MSPDGADALADGWADWIGRAGTSDKRVAPEPSRGPAAPPGRAALAICGERLVAGAEATADGLRLHLYSPDRQRTARRDTALP